ncbi:YihY/virulence factor BrkB family protein [bacterium]|nr:YihY/virulence factor BrkB family protein [bacterium]
MSTQFLNLLRAKTPSPIYRFFEAEIPTRASALAFHTLLAMVPAIGLLFWYLEKVGVTQYWLSQIQSFMLSHINVSSSESFSNFYQSLTGASKGSSFGMVATLVFTYTSLSVLKKLGDSMDAILKTHELEWDFSQNFFKVMIRRIMVLVGLPLAIIASIAIAAWIKQDSWLRPLFNDGPYSGLLSMPIPWVIDGIAFFFLYRFVPRRDISSYEALRAAIFVVPLFELAKYGIGAYNVYAISTHKIWGAFSAIPFFFIWIQLAWTILLSGTLLIRNNRSK